MSTTILQIRKDHLPTTRWHERADEPLAPGQVRVRIDRFALTSNNITYAAFGEAMNYWRFYPTGEEGWGVIPVWGFATVVESTHPEVPVGERVYGYLPMASHTVLTSVRVSAGGWADGAPHRAELHPVYNQLTRCATDPFYTPDTEVVGLTSPGNVAFCESLGCYDRVLTYDQLDAIDADAACVYVDFAGNSDLRRAIHTRFVNLKHSSSIGGTHVEHLGAAKDLPGPRATLFFAPAQIKKRAAEWGPAGLNQRLIAARQAFSKAVAQPGTPWLVVQTHHGRAAVEAAYAQVLSGRGDPRLGHMLQV